MGSRPTTSNSKPQSGHETRSPLSVSSSTWTSASHSGQLPFGTGSPPQVYVHWTAKPVWPGNPVYFSKDSSANIILQKSAPKSSANCTNFQHQITLFEKKII